MTFGNPWVCRMFKNSKVSISKPNLASTQSRTRSAILAQSSMAAVSLGHSTNVIRFFLPVMTVMGPVTVLRLWFVYILTSDLINVDFPTPGGPMTTTTLGGESSISVVLRSFWGTYSFFWARSRFRWLVRLVRPILATEKARGLCFNTRVFSFLSFLSFFPSLAPRPAFLALWPWLPCLSSPSMVVDLRSERFCSMYL